MTHRARLFRRDNLPWILHGLRRITMMPQLSAIPHTALVDEKVTISASGLLPGHKVTVSAVLKEKTTYISHGHFVADEDGKINLKSQSSLGGTYSGLDSMGLLWSMCPAPGEKSTSRLVKSDVTQPFTVHLSLLDGHVTFEEVPVCPTSSVMATAKMERWFKHSSVLRAPVREGALRGTLFLPAGKGPFPGVIDLFGSTGGLLEFRAALLASRGFATMALGYLGYDDLTKDMNELDLEYFLQAVDWLSVHPAVSPGGIGVYGVSKGAELGVLMAAYSPKVKAVVSINGAQVYTFIDLKRGGSHFHKGVAVDLSKLKITDGMIIAQNAYPGWEEHLIPIWKSDAQFLLVCGEDDQTWDNRRAEFLLNRLPPEKLKNIEHRVYPGAGHLIEPPYTPLCYASFHKIAGINVVWGGSPKLHAQAEEDVWHRSLDFLHQNLSKVEDKTTGAPVCSRL